MNAITDGQRIKILERQRDMHERWGVECEEKAQQHFITAANISAKINSLKEKNGLR